MEQVEEDSTELLVSGCGCQRIDIESSKEFKIANDRTKLQDDAKQESFKKVNNATKELKKEHIS